MNVSAELVLFPFGAREGLPAVAHEPADREPAGGHELLDVGLRLHLDEHLAARRRRQRGEDHADGLDARLVAGEQETLGICRRVPGDGSGGFG